MKAVCLVAAVVLVVGQNVVQYGFTGQPRGADFTKDWLSGLATDLAAVLLIWLAFVLCWEAMPS